MICCFLAQDTRCLCHFFLGSVSSSDLRVKGEGRQEKGLLPSCSRPLTRVGGCPRATGARGRGRRAFRDAGLAGCGVVLKEQSLLGAAGLEGRPQPFLLPR